MKKMVLIFMFAYLSLVFPSCLYAGIEEKHNHRTLGSYRTFAFDESEHEDGSICTISTLRRNESTLVYLAGGRPLPPFELNKDQLNGDTEAKPLVMAEDHLFPELKELFLESDLYVFGEIRVFTRRVKYYNKDYQHVLIQEKKGQNEKSPYFYAWEIIFDGDVSIGFREYYSGIETVYNPKLTNYCIPTNFKRKMQKAKNGGSIAVLEEVNRDVQMLPSVYTSYFD